MEGRRAAWLWVSALALALLFLGTDSARRLDAIERATDAALGTRLEPEVEADSRSGYRWNQHRLLLTQADGYQWVMQAEQAIDQGELRVRDTLSDNAPLGREVHWAGLMRWWAQGLQRVYRFAAPELSPPQALERVAPWANAALLAAFLVVLTPLMAARFGSLPAALFAGGSVTVSPLYDLFAVGYLDHHGVAAMSGVMAVLLMLGGGAGWVRGEEEPVRSRPDEGALGDWIPTHRTARRWFACSGLAGAIGLWVSAATTVPVLLGLGFGALACAGVVRGGPRPPRSSWRLEPSLFRVWGAAGAVASLCLYLLEYFPHDLGVRLEVNHPLYSLAFLGAGDLLARTLSREAPPSGSARAWLLADLAMVLSLPGVILLTGESTFRIADPFLWTLHDRYIVEFLDLRTWMLTRPPATVAAEMSLVPLIVLIMAGVLWPTALEGRRRMAWRALLLPVVAAGATYAYVFILGVGRGNEAIAVVGALGAVALWFIWPAFHRARELPPPARSVVLLSVVPAALMLVMALIQQRWLGIAAGLGLAALVATAKVLFTVDHALVRAPIGRLAAGALVLGVVALPPIFADHRPVAPANIDAITRDASFWLRRRLGDQQGVVLTGPTATNHMIWFGGFRGVGTLYWENLDGLRASEEAYGAPDPDSARALLGRLGITHVAFYGWDGGLEQLLFSAGSAQDRGGSEEPRGVLHRVELELRANESASLPPWLVPLPYVPPRVSGYGHPIVHLLEVVDELPPEVALVRLARYYQVLGDPRMDEALARSLEIRPTVHGLAMLAQLQRLREDRPAFLMTIERLRAQLAEGATIEMEDRFEAAIALGLAGDQAEISRQLDAVLAQADEAQLRRLRAERLSLLVDLSRDFGLDRARPEIVALAGRLMQTP